MSAAASYADTLAPHWAPLCVSRLHYHVTWPTRGRKAVLQGRRVEAVRSALQVLARERGVKLETVAVLADRVHLILSLRPTDCAASVVRELRGRSALALLRELPELRVALGGNLLWGETYGISTVSPGKLTQRLSRLARLESGEPGASLTPAECSRR